MQDLIALFKDHPTYLVVVGWVLNWIFSAFVSGMPEPKDTSGVGYVWLYRSLHALAGNLTTVSEFLAKKAGIAK